MGGWLLETLLANIKCARWRRATASLRSWWRWPCQIVCPYPPQPMFRGGEDGGEGRSPLL